MCWVRPLSFQAGRGYFRLKSVGRMLPTGGSCRHQTCSPCRNVVHVLACFIRPTAHIIGPNFTAYSDIPHLATEASGRKVCSLESTGDTLEVTLKQPANALELRYSIPDSPGGGGQAASISVTATDADGNALPMRVLDILHPTQNASSVHSVSASEALHLSMTSAFSWFYGNYPFTNNPADGNPHHFFDEVRHHSFMHVIQLSAGRLSLSCAFTIQSSGACDMERYS